MRRLFSAIAISSLILSAPVAAQDTTRVPVVAAGMEWVVDPASCEVGTPVEGSQVFDKLTLTSSSLGNRVDNYQLSLREEQMKVPKQVTLLANGNDPIAMPVSIPIYGPTGAFWFNTEDGDQTVVAKLTGNETVMLFAVFEMISLSPYGFSKAQEARHDCLTDMLAGVGLDIADFWNADGSNAGLGAMGDIRGLFFTDDYPTAALRKGEQGTVRTAIVIGADGRPKKCLVVQSSGSRILDEVTCEVIVDRARFEPARDAADVAVPSIYTSPPIRWQIHG